MLSKHEQRWAWPGTLFSFSPPPPLPPSSSSSRLSLKSHSKHAASFARQSGKRPERLSVDSLPSPRSHLSPSDFKAHASRRRGRGESSPKKKRRRWRQRQQQKQQQHQPRRNPHSQGGGGGFSQLREHSSQIIVILNVLPSFCLSAFFFLPLCFLFRCRALCLCVNCLVK